MLNSIIAYFPKKREVFILIFLIVRAGIGIDCHLKFIEVCVRYRNGSAIQKAQAQFSTRCDSLIEARDWCLNVLNTKADPVPNLSDPLHYLMESTANYHMPVCMAFGGNPTIINPTIAGATKRKTDYPASPFIPGDVAQMP